MHNGQCSVSRKRTEMVSAPTVIIVLKLKVPSANLLKVLMKTAERRLRTTGRRRHKPGVHKVGLCYRSSSLACYMRANTPAYSRIPPSGNGPWSTLCSESDFELYRVQQTLIQHTDADGRGAQLQAEGTAVQQLAVNLDDLAMGNLGAYCRSLHSPREDTPLSETPHSLQKCHVGAKHTKVQTIK